MGLVGVFRLVGEVGDELVCGEKDGFSTWKGVILAVLAILPRYLWFTCINCFFVLFVSFLQTHVSFFESSSHSFPLTGILYRFDRCT